MTNQMSTNRRCSVNRELLLNIADRKQAEERIIHLNTILRAIRNINQLIIKKKDRDSLLRKACDIMIEARGYDAAWLGFFKDDETFATVKGSGFGEGMSRFSEHVMGGDHPSCIRSTIAQKEKLFIVGKSRECGDCFFKDACTDREAAIIRVEHVGRLFGLLAILFAPDVTVDEEEKDLLREVADDIALALYNMEMEEKRKLAENALKEAYDIVNRSPSVAFLWKNAEGWPVEFVSDNVKELFGYTAEEFTSGKVSYVETVHPDDLERVAEEVSTYSKEKEGKKVIREPYRIITKNGGMIWVDDRTNIRRNEKGNITHYEGIVIDITELKRAQEKLREHSKNLEGMVEERTRLPV
ncbi:MAG: PAS domain-containing protein [Syntrophales bacterium]|nr:PAS domain-containing protein [Syntrophales bacterium]